ncbi:MAG: hypothetical protein ACUVRS_09530 [Armatimonadota bacterium]
MDWLKDKKNQPIVAAILGIIIVGAGAAVYFTMFAGGGAQPAPATTAETVPPDTATLSPTTEPGAPTATPGTTPMGTEPMQVGMTGAPGTTVAPGEAQAAIAAPPPGGAVPMEPWREDPFLPLGYKPKKVGPKPKPRITDFPFQKFAQWVPPRRKPLPEEKPQPSRRVAGIIVSDRVYAIIETVGKPNMEIVQPGDVLEDRLAKVERIERDKVVLRTMDKVPRFMTVPITSAPRTTSAAVTTTTSPMPGYPVGPMSGPRGRPGGPHEAGVGEPMMGM